MEPEPISPTTTSPAAPSPAPAQTNPTAGAVLPPKASFSNLEHDVQDVQSMNIVFGGAILVLTIVVTGIVCYLGNIQIPYVSAYFAPAPVPANIMVESNQLPPSSHKNTPAAPATTNAAATSTNSMASSTAMVTSSTTATKK